LRLDEALAPELRAKLEVRLWQPIEAAASLEVVRHDPRLLDESAVYLALFADHGTVHVRDIAQGVLDLADLANGVLLPRRPPIVSASSPPGPPPATRSSWKRQLVTPCSRSGAMPTTTCTCFGPTA
jgi:hypothetical protein